MSTRLYATIITAALSALPVAQAAGPRAILIEARNLAYDANYRNDQGGLRSAIAILRTLTQAPQEGAYAHYYVAWSYWMLSASQMEDKNMSAARESAALAVDHARLAVAARGKDPEFHTVLVNALTFLAILDPTRRKEIRTELTAARRNAIELGPDNPRTLLMDAGMIFWAPPEQGGSQAGGIARWHEALRLFDAEANATAVDPIAPRWGYALSYGWMASNYLAMSPPQKENARNAAETALQLRPDFWYARERVLPRALEVAGESGADGRAAPSAPQIASPESPLSNVSLCPTQ